MKLIAGRAKTGKSTYIYDEIKNEIDKNNDDNLILIVPEMMTYEAEYEIIERLNSEGIINVDVISFKRLATRIFDEVGLKKVNILESFGKIMLLKQIFQENIDELKIFKKACNQEGFLREFDLLIRELKQNLVSPNSLVQSIDKIDNYFLKYKLFDISLIYSKYNERIKDNFIDEEDYLELLISSIKNSKYIKNSRIWIDGFESFNNQRINLIKVLWENAKDISVSLNIDSSYIYELESNDDWEAFKTLHDTYSTLREEIGDINIIKLSGIKTNSEEIRAIEKNILSLKLEEFNSQTDNINITSSMNPYSETEKVANEMISLVRDFNYRWKDIKVAVTDTDSYGIHIKKIFDKYEIPYFLDIKRDIMNNPLSKYLLSILDMFIWNFRYDNVFEYLKTGLTPMDDSQINYLENYALQYGIEGDKWFQEIEIDNKYSYLEDVRKLFANGLKKKVNKFRNLKTTYEITTFLFDFIEQHDINRKVQNSISEFLKVDKFEESSEYSQAWNFTMDIFEQLLLINEDVELTPLEYRKLLEAGLREVKISVIPPTIDKVEIGDIDRIATSKSKALFIVGANEGKFEANSEKGLLLDDERQLLLDNNIQLVRPGYKYFKDKHLLYKAFSSPHEKLYISYSLGTVEGRSLQPSLYIDTLRRMFPLVREESDISNRDGFDQISCPNGTYDILVENIRRYIDGYDIEPIWKEVFTWYRENAKGIFETIYRGLYFENNIQHISPDLIDEIYKDNMTTTISKLETFAQCQFRYYLENILRIRPRQVQKIEAYDIGNINHNVLESFINKIIEIEDIQALNKEDIENIVNECIDNVLEDMSKNVTAFNANNRNKYLKERFKRVLNRTAYTMVMQLKRSEFRPKYTELQIDMVDKNDEKVQKGIYIDPVEIVLDDMIVNLRGKIDRVDVYEDDKGEIYISIIDYKSYGKDIDFTDVSEGIQLQLLIYLDAIIQNGEKLFGKAPKIAGVFYYHVDDPMVKEQVDDPEEHIFKQLKLKGYVLKDKSLVYKMDKELNSSSDIIPVGIKKDGDFSVYSKVLSDEEFDLVLNYIRGKVIELTSRILSGKIEINPYRKSNGATPCSFCDYRSICQFDRNTGNDYIRIKNLGKEQFLKICHEKGGASRDGMDKRATADN